MRFIYACLVLMTVVLASAAAEAVTPADYAGRFEVDMKRRYSAVGGTAGGCLPPNRFTDRKFDYFGISAKYSTRGFAQTIHAVTEPAKPG